MRRRRLLRSLALGASALVAGCPGSEGGGTGPDTGEAGEGTSVTPPATGMGRKTDSPPDCAGIEFEEAVDTELSSDLVVVADGGRIETRAAVVDRTTDDSPARLALAVRNGRGERTSLQFGLAPPLAGLTLDGEGTDDALVLLPERRPDEMSVEDANGDGTFAVLPDGPTEDCWTAVDRPWLASDFEVVELAACGTLRREFLVLGHPENDGCPSAGTYSRTDRATVRDEEGRGNEDEFDLRLSVTVS